MTSEDEKAARMRALRRALDRWENEGGPPAPDNRIFGVVASSPIGTAERETRTERIAAEEATSVFARLALIRIVYVEVCRDGGTYEGLIETSAGSLLTVVLQCRRGAPFPAESAEPTHGELFACLDAVDRHKTVRATVPIPKGSDDELVLLRMLHELLAITSDHPLVSLVASIEQRVDRE